MATPTQQSQVEQLDSFVIESIEDVFSTLLNWSVKPLAAQDSQEPAPFELLEVNGCIGFCGKLTGSVFFSCSNRLAMQMAQVILGPDSPIRTGDLAEVVGKLTNMLAGGCKSRLGDCSCPVALSIPTIICGKRLYAASKDVRFLIQRPFLVPRFAEEIKVITAGKFD
jgi:CheY-specific phosphatase CheX